MEECIAGEWDVCFHQCVEKEDIAEISIKEEGMMLISETDARINERIKAEYGE